ncbi:MAG: hypothetical protein M4579_003362 [Chaenotheca gracillima]|nr:MAG: hypothetical protein M4579_003362 [Chaenotheca gracillima]
MNAAFQAMRSESPDGRRPRGRSSSPADSLKEAAAVRERSEDRNEMFRRGRDRAQMPSFMSPTPSEIKEKFEDLEWLQRKRLLEGMQDQTSASRWTLDLGDEVKLRNRYLNIQPWAHNRIHLDVGPGQHDYINASPILLRTTKSKRDVKYIASQGPKEGQFNHIWRMIWDETANPAVVVMLTQTYESGREKCMQYFPETMENNTMTFDENEFGDNFSAVVKLLEVHSDPISRSTVRKLRLSVGSKSKTVWHLLFAGWPDFSVPEGADRAALVELINLSSRKNTASGSPRIVHCSAGVGRSGTFITLDYLLRELKEGALVRHSSPPGSPERGDPVFTTVNLLREQRMTMVQSEMQLNLIYQLLKEQWQQINTPAPSRTPSSHGFRRKEKIDKNLEDPQRLGNIDHTGARATPGVPYVP